MVESLSNISDKRRDAAPLAGQQLGSIFQTRARVFSLSDYLKSVLLIENLSLEKVQFNSGGLISKQYVSNLVIGHVTNPTISKAQALARGLGRDEDEVFRVLRGLPVQI